MSDVYHESPNSTTSIYRGLVEQQVVGYTKPSTNPHQQIEASGVWSSMITVHESVTSGAKPSGSNLSVLGRVDVTVPPAMCDDRPQ